MSVDAGRVEVNVFSLSSQEIDDVLSQRLLARLATYEADGGIHVVPMWYMRRDDTIVIPTSRQTHKIALLRRRPVASVAVDQYGAGAAVRGVMVRGEVSILDGDEALSTNCAIHERYVDAEALKSGPLADYLEGDDVTVAISMDKVHTWKVSTDPEDASPFPSISAFGFLRASFHARSLGCQA